MNEKSGPAAAGSVRDGLVAILRGITPAETADHVEVLIEEGFRTIEITLNSPDPFASIGIAVKTEQRLLAGRGLIGAGTVLLVEQVQKTRDVGGMLIVSPNVNRAVIEASLHAGMASLPGVFTATEALAAVAAGAESLKFFPASVLGPTGMAAIRAVLPGSVRLFAVGGVGPEDFAAYRSAGASGFGVGSVLYRPGRKLSEFREDARRIMRADSEPETSRD